MTVSSAVFETFLSFHRIWRLIATGSVDVAEDEASEQCDWGVHQNPFVMVS